MDDFWVYTSVRDEEHIMPFFLRHYMDYADKVIVQDCGSKDRTKQIVKNAGAELYDSGEWGMDEGRRRDEANALVLSLVGKCRWVACVDADEFILGDFDKAFESAEEDKCDVIHCMGYTMLAPEFPKDDGKSQIYDICYMGIQAGAEKPCVAKTGSRFLWSLGKHFIDSPGTRISLSGLALLHYRYLGYEYTKSRSAKNYANSPNKATAWCCAPNYTGDESPDGVRRALEGNKAQDLRKRLIEHLTMSQEAMWNAWHGGKRVFVR